MLRRLDNVSLTMSDFNSVGVAKTQPTDTNSKMRGKNRKEKRALPSKRLGQDDSVICKPVDERGVTGDNLRGRIVAEFRAW